MMIRIKQTMALTDGSPQSSELQHQFMGAPIAPVQNLRPPHEGVFDSGQKFYFQGEVAMREEDLTWTLTVPENLAYDGLAMFVNGYTGIEQSAHAPREGLSSNGIATLSYSAARGGANWLEGVTSPQRVHAIGIKRLAADVMQRADIKTQLPNAKELDFEKLLLVAHSMGGLGASRYAEMEPGHVDAIINLAACGYGHPTLKELISDLPKGSLPGVWHELIPSLLGGEIKATRRNMHDLRNYILKRRYPFEGLSCLLEDSRPRVSRLRDLGIFVAYQAYEHDILVRADPAVAEYVDYHETLPGAGHLAPMRKKMLVGSKVREILENRLAVA